ncbi:MAG: Zinc metalloprotease [uncultured Paraburkholderia sp.]|nr:MAG: Zinc metalloprotease [uncultured Paraburkholderia sp.]
MQKSSKPQPAAALDSRQLDLPLFAEPGSTLTSPSPAAPAAMPLASDAANCAA